MRLRASGADPCELMRRKERRAVLLGEEMIRAMLYFWVSRNLSGDIDYTILGQETWECIKGRGEQEIKGKA